MEDKRISQLNELMTASNESVFPIVENPTIETQKITKLNFLKEVVQAISDLDTIIQNLEASDIGLGNVDNTSDLDKPISNAMQTALDLKANISALANVAISGNYNDLLNLPALFDGDYNSLSNLPVLFDGDYNSLSNLPVLFDGDYMSLSNIPTSFPPSAHTHTLSDITDAGDLASLNTITTSLISDFISAVQAISISSVGADPNPILGGNLILGTQTITNNNNVNINIDAVGTGSINLNSGSGSLFSLAGNGNILAVANPNQNILFGTSGTGVFQIVGNATIGGLLNGRNITDDGTKLDTIEENADVTNTENVTDSLSLTTTSSNSVSFTIPRQFGTPSSPRTGNITQDLSNAKTAIIQKIYHNAGTAPTFPSEWVRLGAGDYETSELNIIYAEYVSATRVEYWIVQEA